MKLIDLDPRWTIAGGPGIRDRNGGQVPRREGVGLAFDCPCGQGQDHRVYVAFDNPLDGGPPYTSSGQPTWHRDGEDFETLTVTPSIKSDASRGGCGWHGWIKNGEVTGKIERGFDGSVCLV